MKNLLSVIIFIFTFFLFSTIKVFAWDDCPLGEVNDEYPGDCAKYIDTDNDGICDRSQLAPEDRVDVDTTDLENKEEHEEEHEEDYSVEISGGDLKLLTVQEVAERWGIDADRLLSRMIVEFDLKEEYTTYTLIEELREEYKFSPAIVKDIAEDIKENRKQEDSDVGIEFKEEVELPYNFGVPFFTSIVLYVISWILVKERVFKKYTIIFHNGLWNTVLLIYLIPSVVFGFYLVLRHSFLFLREIKFNFLYWHVEGSIVMGTVAIMHLIQRFGIYTKQLKVFKKIRLRK